MTEDTNNSSSHLSQLRLRLAQLESRGETGYSGSNRLRTPRGFAKATKTRFNQSQRAIQKRVMNPWSLCPSLDSLPYYLFGLSMLCFLGLPFYLLFESGLPEPKQLFEPLSRDMPSKSVASKPKSGLHFTPGVLEGEGRALGKVEAQFHVVEFTDFFCHHCQAAHDVVANTVLKKYVSTGKLRFESHPVAFLDDDSLRAAAAALCAQEQHKYWEIRDLLFQVDLTTKPSRAKSIFNAALLRRLATLAGLEVKAFSTCFYSKRYVDEVHRLSKLSREMGVIGTPHFIINNEHVEGVVEEEQFVQRLGKIYNHVQK